MCGWSIMLYYAVYLRWAKLKLKVLVPILSLVGVHDSRLPPPLPLRPIKGTVQLALVLIISIQGYYLTTLNTCH